MVQNPPARAADVQRRVQSWAGKIPGGGHGNPLQFLVWRIPRAEEPGGLQSMGGREVDTTEET